MRKLKSGGGWQAMKYSFKLFHRVGWLNMWRSMSARNTCKTCAVGMGGQSGGMKNEAGHFPEVCKKSFQAMASDLQAAIPADFFEKMTIPKLRSLSSRELENSGRLVQPMICGPKHDQYRPISWEDAFDKIAGQMNASGPDKTFFYVSGRSSNEAGFLLQMMARLFGTNFVNNCSFYCHQPSGVGLTSSLGTGAGTVQLEDLDKTDLYILVGANPASNHPRLMRTLMEIRRRGGKVVVLNPVKELGLVNFKVPSDVRSLLFGSEIASTYIQPHIGGDMALLAGVAKNVLESNAQSQQFIDEHTEGFAEFKDQIDQTSWDEIITKSGVDRATIDDLSRQYMDAKNCVIAWAMGITHHLHATENVQMIANVALLRAMVGRREAGVMPIRGHSNVQGMGSVGVVPQLKTNMLERFEQKLGISIPKSPGYDTMACMQAARRGEMETAFCLGGNLFGSNPDAQFATEAFGNLKLNVYLSTTLNTGHAWGLGQETIILPVFPRDEEPQPTTQESMFSFVRMSDGGTQRLEGPRSEVSIINAIAKKLLGSDSPIDWDELESHSAIRKLISELIPGYEQLGEIDATKKEFHVTGRTLEGYNFPTPSGKAKFHALPIPEPPALQDNELRLMTVRSEGQFNTVVYDEEDIYRGQERRDVILLNETDMQKLGLTSDQRVRVKSGAGEMRYLLARPFFIRAGNALMYYPEANALVSTEVDDTSKTPSYKSIVITITPEEVASEQVATPVG
ncbi:Formate dehydrogenase H [Polystyrenella longa]|uniref:Formate dehydrogenase H n=1 Tax=Polystyrenella longa TaxID=2528007 RepID=A0A518CU56_9PLAN|nr:FdhF/YdeP family oxidoreductase [Polystyrenella longa]QDU82762.1 Formate dehydrogenase H [Polystyrenella longa]